MEDIVRAIEHLIIFSAQVIINNVIRDILDSKTSTPAQA